MILRRKRLPGHLEAPSRALDELIPSLERARAALTESVPGTRLPGRPLAESLSEFEDGLREVRARMGGWRAPEVEQACLDASAGDIDHRDCGHAHHRAFEQLAAGRLVLVVAAAQAEPSTHLVAPGVAGRGALGQGLQGRFDR